VGSFFLGNNYFDSPYGGSFNKDLRAMGEARTTVSVSERYTVAFGAAYSREEVKNSFISDNSFRSFPLRRDQQGYYFENRLQFRRFFLNAGIRTEVFETPMIPASQSSGRPDLAARTTARVNPKIAAGFSLLHGMRAHGSFGTGIRPPGGFDLAFTNNPALKAERTWSVDAGIEQSIGNRVSLDATCFFNRYSDLIVSLGGSLARLGSYRSDNLSNSRAQGAEFSARFRPGSWMMVAGSYTYLDSEVLSLDGGVGLAPQFFRVGQSLLRRPRHSGSIVGSFTHKRVSANLIACMRGETLDTEPNFGASAGLFPNPGFTNVGVNVNYHLGRGVTLYGNLRNALNQRYEEIYGFPAQRLNFVAGIKWRFMRE
ncbi:MAG: TonB-dependent receptor, partial [Bryobacteraceae bacterium]